MHRVVKSQNQKAQESKQSLARKNKAICKKVTCASIVHDAPRRGSKHIAQGIALGNGMCNDAPCKGKSIIAEIIFYIA